MVRGPKGTGKSALFELLTRFGSSARRVAAGKLDGVLLVAGSGFQDLQEVATDDIEALKSEAGYDHERLWRLYVALKVALALKPHASLSTGPVKELLRAAGALRDARLLPLLQLAWRRFVSPNVPERVKVGVMRAAVEIVSRKQRIDVTDLLNDAEHILDSVNKSVWVLFDKIDELYAGNRSERKRAIEGLMLTTMSLRRTFPRIRTTVFIRSDIWSNLEFTNKSHLADKILELKWSHNEIQRLLVKAAASHPAVERLIQGAVPEFVVAGADSMSNGIIERSLAAILPKQLKFRDKIHNTLTWLVIHVRDGNGTYPREAILWCNRAADMERGIPNTTARVSMISDSSLINTYPGVSVSRCESYLTEFPDLREHFTRFQGQEGPRFQKNEMLKFMKGLTPSGDEMLRALTEVGVILPEGNLTVAESFDVPVLYRRGLGLTTLDWV